MDYQQIKYPQGQKEQQIVHYENISVKLLFQVFRNLKNSNVHKFTNCSINFNSEQDKLQFNRILSQCERENERQYEDTTPYNVYSSDNEDLSNNEEALGETDSEDEEIEQQILEQEQEDQQPLIQKNQCPNASIIFTSSFIRPSKNKDLANSFKLDVKSYNDALVLNSYFNIHKDPRIIVTKPNKEQEIAHYLVIKLKQNATEEMVKGHLEITYGSLFSHKVFLNKCQYLQMRNSRRLQKELYDRFQVNFAFDVNYIHQSNPNPNQLYFILYGQKDALFQEAQKFILTKKLVKIYLLTLSDQILTRKYSCDTEIKSLAFIRMEVFKKKFEIEKDKIDGKIYEIADIPFPKILQKQGIILVHNEKFENIYSQIYDYFKKKIYWQITTMDKLKGSTPLSSHFRQEQQGNEHVTMFLTNIEQFEKNVSSIIKENIHQLKKIVIQTKQISLAEDNYFEIITKFDDYGQNSEVKKKVKQSKEMFEESLGCLQEQNKQQKIINRINSDVKKSQEYYNRLQRQTFPSKQTRPKLQPQIKNSQNNAEQKKINPIQNNTSQNNHTINSYPKKQVQINPINPQTNPNLVNQYTSSYPQPNLDAVGFNQINSRQLQENQNADQFNHLKQNQPQPNFNSNYQQINQNQQQAILNTTDMNQTYLSQLQINNDLNNQQQNNWNQQNLIEQQKQYQQQLLLKQQQQQQQQLFQQQQLHHQQQKQLQQQQQQQLKIQEQQNQSIIPYACEQESQQSTSYNSINNDKIPNTLNIKQSQQKMTDERQSQIKTLFQNNKKLIEEKDYIKLDQQVYGYIQEIKRKNPEVYELNLNEAYLKKGNQQMKYYQSIFNDDKFKLRKIDDRKFNETYLYIFLINESNIIKEDELFYLKECENTIPKYFIKLKI